jgi:hypothetical protein
MLCARLAIDRESPLVGSLATLRQLRGDPPTTSVRPTMLDRCSARPKPPRAAW